MEKLPESVIIEEILTRVPLRDAVRTSVLSPAWHQLWRSIPDLHFVDYDGNIPVASINSVLLSHSLTSPIRSFSVTCYAVAAADTDPWLRHLSLNHQHSLSSLKFYFFKYDEYDEEDPLPPPPPRNLDSSLFSFLSLKSLKLSHCSLPRSDSTFPLLQKLSLNDVTFPDEHCIHRLISTSSKLTRLTLIKVVPSLLDLIIPNPNLRHFCFIDHHCNSIVFAAAQTLGYVSISVDGGAADKQFDLARSFSAGAVCNNTLNLTEDTIKAIAKNGVPQSIPTCFQNLRKLDVEVDFAEAGNIMLLLCLMRSAPNLRILKISGGDDYWRQDITLDQDFWKQHAVCRLDRLQTVELHLCSFIQAEIDFMVYVLERAKMLKKLRITNALSSTYLSDSTINMLKNYQRASPKAKIICKRS